MATLTPELKAYLDEWRAEIRSMCDELRGTRRRLLTCLAEPLPTAPATTTPLVVALGVPVDTSALVPAPVASSDTADLALASAELAEPAAPVPAIWETPEVTPVVSINTRAMVPATCSTGCAAQATPSSTPASASATNRVVSIEPVHDNDAGEQGTLPDDITVNIIPVLAAATGGSGILDDEFIKGAASTAPTPATKSSMSVTPGVPITNITVVPATCLMEYPGRGANELKPASTIAAALTSPTATLNITPLLELTAADYIERSPVVCSFCLAECRDVVITGASDTPTTMTLLMLCSSLSASTTPSCRCHGPLLRPSAWPSFLGVQINAPEKRPRPWPSFSSSCGGWRQQQFRLPRQERHPSLVKLKPFPAEKHACCETTNFGARQCLLATAVMKPIDTSFPASSSSMLQLVVFPGNGEWCSYCCLLDCIFGPYDSWGVQCNELGAAKSVRQELVNYSYCYLQSGALQNLETHGSCAWETLWLQLCLYHRADYFRMTVSVGKYQRYTACLILQGLPHSNATNLIVNDFSGDNSRASIFNSETVLMRMEECLLSMFWLNFDVKCINLNGPQVLVCTSMVVYGLIHQARYCSCFTLVTDACKSAMEFGIQLEALCSFDIQLPEAHSSVYARSTLRIYLVNEANQKTPGICAVIPAAILYDPNYSQWEIAWQRDGECFDYFQWLAAWALSILTKIDTYVEEGAHPHGEVLTVISETNLLTLGSHVGQQVGGCLLWTCSQAKQYISCNRLLPACKQTEATCALLIVHHSWLGSMILGVLRLRLAEAYSLLDDIEHNSNLHELCLTLPSVWQHVKYIRWSWDPGGCTLALCSSKKKWSTLHCYEQYQWSSLQLACAFQIWLVPWILDDWDFSTWRGQAPFQGGRDMLRADFSTGIHDTCNYYIGFLNQIFVGYDHYLYQTYYFGKCYSDTVYHSNFSKTEEVYTPWDPGKSVLHYHRKVRLGDKPNFKEGGMLGAYSATTCTWAGHLGRCMGQVRCNPKSCTLHIGGSEQRPSYPSWIRRNGGGGFLSHLGSASQSPSCCSCPCISC